VHTLRFGINFARLALLILAPVLGLLACARLDVAQSNSISESRRREFLQHLIAAAVERTHHVVRYDPAYVRISYPGGDVPADTGACTDEIIRSYRSVGVDLQKEIHENMVRNFELYPRRWRWVLSRSDPNIDHRRVPNLMVFFARKGESLPLSGRADDYAPGDFVAWDLGGGVPNIGVVVDQKSAKSGRYMIVHNIGQGPRMEDIMFNWKVTGHYRYFGPAL
jgi:uncharacterized protein YijF (DUF1287 family)